MTAEFLLTSLIVVATRRGHPLYRSLLPRSWKTRKSDGR